MIRYPEVSPIAFRVGPIKVHWYGIMYLVAFTAAWTLGRLRAGRNGSSWAPRDVDDLVFFGMLGVILGGRIGYVLFYGLSFWAADAWYPLKIWDGGMSFHGGLIGTVVAMTVFALRRQRAVADVFDFAAPLPGIGICAVRIGNFINGELWGKPTTLPWGFMFQGVVRQPSQLYEGFLEGIVLFTILWIYTKRPRPRLAPSGLFLLCYGLARFAVEFVRVPDAQIGYLFDGWLTMGQVLSLPMIIAGAIMLVHSYAGGVPSGNFLPGPMGQHMSSSARNL